MIFAPEPIYEYRDYLTKVDDELSTLAWLYHMNHGIFMTPGVEEEWTLSIAHEDEDRRRYLDAFEAFANDVTGLGSPHGDQSRDKGCGRGRQGLLRCGRRQGRRRDVRLLGTGLSTSSTASPRCVPRRASASGSATPSGRCRTFGWRSST